MEEEEAGGDLAAMVVDVVVEEVSGSGVVVQNFQAKTFPIDVLLNAHGLAHSEYSSIWSDWRWYSR